MSSKSHPYSGVYIAFAATSTGQWRRVELNRVRSFDAAPHTLDGALLQPVLRFFQVRQRTCIRLASILPRLKAT
jgi:hypothetical protein